MSLKLGSHSLAIINSVKVKSTALFTIQSLASRTCKMYLLIIYFMIDTIWGIQNKISTKSTNYFPQSRKSKK